MQATRLHFVTSVLPVRLRWIFKLKFTSQRWRCVEVMRIAYPRYTWNIDKHAFSKASHQEAYFQQHPRDFITRPRRRRTGKLCFTWWPADTNQVSLTHTHDFLAPDRSASIVAGSGKFPIRREPLGTRRDTYQAPNAWPPQLPVSVSTEHDLLRRRKRATGRRNRKLSQNGLKFSTPEGTNCCRKLNWIKKRMINWYADGGWYASGLFSAAHPR